MDNNDKVVLIMAGGLGKRMNSNLPKVLHKVKNKPMIVYLIENALLLKPCRLLIVVGKYEKIIKDTINSYVNNDIIEYVKQEEPLGTGHAIMCTKYVLEKYTNKKLLILSGDTPLVDSDLMNSMFDNMKYFKLCITNLDNPYGYGRIVERSNVQKYTKIVEEKDCDDGEKMIKNINCGIYCININLLLQYINCISNNNNQNEYYLTEIVEIITKNENINVELLVITQKDNYKILGVNTPEQLNEIEKYL